MTRKGPRTGWTRAAIVAVMAYAFLLQALLLSFSGSFHAAAAAEGQGILCLQDGSSSPDHGPMKAHEKLCCIASCHGSGPAGPVPAAAIPARIGPADVAGGKAAAALHLPHTSDVLPLGSRAPPRLS